MLGVTKEDELFFEGGKEEETGGGGSESPIPHNTIMGGNWVLMEWTGVTVYKLSIYHILKKTYCLEVHTTYIYTYNLSIYLVLKLLTLGFQSLRNFILFYIYKENKLLFQYYEKYVSNSQIICIS